MAAKKKASYTFAVGRRKEAVARVRVYEGKGETVVNAKPIAEYFRGETGKAHYELPFKLTDTAGKYWASVKVVGGGKNSQLAALVHGISRAFSALDKDKFRAPLKKAGLLTRDARVRERRKVGTGGKARRKKQSPKR